MPNYTITRDIEANHVNKIGCTEWETTQEEQQAAGHNTALDGSIVWEIKANTGFVVELPDFDIPNTQPTSATQTAVYRTFKDDGGGSGLPLPINGVVMEQIREDFIRMTIYLYPSTSDNITGLPVFIMPDHDVSRIIKIAGCARVKGEGVHLRIIKPDDQTVETEVLLNSELGKRILHNSLGENKTLDEIHGKLGSTGVNEVFEKENYIMTYTVNASDGYRFAIPPKLDFNDVDYYYKTKVEYTRNPYQPKNAKEDYVRQDITKITFDIYKKR